MLNKESDMLGIIPARSGSKGLKDKNIKLLNGKPLIAYSIEEAIKSNAFKKVIVSTDSELYADIGRKYGASVPCLRSEKLAKDTSTTNDVIEEVISWVDKQEFKKFMLLQPTSPLRTVNDIVAATNLFEKKDANAVISLCEVDHSPLYTGTIPESLRIDGFLSKDISHRRQDLPTYYRLNGAIYLCNIDYFLKYRNFYEEQCYAYIMDKKTSIDIDDAFDFDLASYLLRLSAD